MRRETARSTAIGMIAGYNVVQNTFLIERGYVTGNVVVGAALIGLGRRSGSSLEQMGLIPRLTSDGRRFMAAAATTAIITIAAGVAHPKTRTFFRDERARGESWQDVRHNTLIRFPLGTAMFEEVVFRGVLPPLLARSEKAGDLLSSALFGLWHVIPTARVLGGSPLGGSANPVRTVAAGSAAAGVGGFLLACARRKSDSTILPWMLHSLLNITIYLGGVTAWRLNGAPEASGAGARSRQL